MKRGWVPEGVQVFGTRDECVRHEARAKVVDRITTTVAADIEGAAEPDAGRLAVAIVAKLIEDHDTREAVKAMLGVRTRKRAAHPAKPAAPRVRRRKAGPAKDGEAAAAAGAAA